MLDLPSLLLSYGIELRQRGNEYQCLCFAHDDHNPSMSVYRNGSDKWVTNCFSCGFHEDTIGVYKYLSGNDDHKAALQALESGDYITDKPYAIIHNDIPPPEVRPDMTMLLPDENTPLPKMGWLKTREGIPFGEPVEVYVYRQPNGLPWYYEGRWYAPDSKGRMRKECRCFIYGHRGSAPARWECSHHLPPRPLYGLDVLAKAPKTSQVVICEGPRKAIAAQSLLPSFPCIGWAQGAKGCTKADWSPLAGRRCLLWPDADEPGREAMDTIAQILLGLGCQVWIFDTSGFPEKWDAADAIAEGWDSKRTLEWAKANKGEMIKLPPPPPPDIDPDGSIYGYGDEPVLDGEQSGTPLPDTQNEMPDDFPEDDDDQAFNYEGITWLEPVDVFHELQAPQVRLDMLPECFRDWMMDTDGVKGVDRSMLAIGAIVSAAACTHVSIKIQPENTNPGWQEPPVLWAAIVGKSGIKKSAAIGSCISRLKKIQIDLSKRGEDLEDDFKSKEMAFELAKKDYIKKLSQKDQTAQKPERPQYPEIRRLIFQDATVEKQADVMSKSPTNCLVDRDELSGWFGSHDAYKNGSGSGDRAAWLDFFEAKPRYVDRIGRGSIFVPVWGGCILGGIQPSAIRKIVESLPEDGLLQRFIPIYARQGREGNKQPYNKAASDRYHDILQQIFDTTPADTPVRMTREASDIREEINRYAAKMVAAGVVSDALCSHLSKYEGISARMMLVFHVIACADKRVHPQACMVSGETAESVKKFMLEFMLPHAVVFYSNLLGQSMVGHNLRKIAELCLLSTKREITTRDMLQGFVGWRHLRPQDQEICLQQLVDHGWILPHPSARMSMKGAPTRYLINPHCVEVHAQRRLIEMDRRQSAIELLAKCSQDVRDLHAPT